MRILLVSCLLVVCWLCAPCHAREKAGREVAVAALALPADSDGLVHWRASDAATSPLQLSTRYFSERLELPGDVIQFFQDQVPEGGIPPPLPVPLVTLKIPADTKLAYIVLWSELDERGQGRWKGRVFDGDGWKAGSLKVLNGCNETIGLVVDKKHIKLFQGKSMDFSANDWQAAFPVKIYRSKPAAKLVFSSTWRVAAGRRELCFVGSDGGSVTLRSLLDLAVPPAKGDP